MFECTSGPRALDLLLRGVASTAVQPQRLLRPRMTCIRTRDRLSPMCLGEAIGASTEAACAGRKTHSPHLVAGAVAATGHTCSGAEQPARTTAAAIVAAAQNGTSGMLADDTYARYQAASATLRIDGRGQTPSACPGRFKDKAGK